MGDNLAPFTSSILSDYCSKEVDMLVTDVFARYVELLGVSWLQNNNIGWIDDDQNVVDKQFVEVNESGCEVLAEYQTSGKAILKWNLLKRLFVIMKRVWVLCIWT